MAEIDDIKRSIYGTPRSAPILSAYSRLSASDQEAFKKAKTFVSEYCGDISEVQDGELETILESLNKIKTRAGEVNVFVKKNEILAATYKEASPFEFYREIFPAGTFERRGFQEDKKPNGVCKVMKKNGQRFSVILTDELSELDSVLDSDSVICSPVSYYGSRRTSAYASMLHGIAIDLDGVGEKQLTDLLFQMQNDIQPIPTFIVNSGHGLHLYYIFEYPIILPPIKETVVQAFQRLKRALTELVWNRYTSTEKNRQIQGIWQGFRMVGSQTKMGKGCRVTAFKVGNKVSVEYLNEFVPDKDKVLQYDDEPRLTLEKAAELYPEWYQRRIVKKQPPKQWKVNRAVFDWWVKEISEKAAFGHRYFCIMTLAVQARRCGISFEELHEVAFSLLDKYNGLSSSDPFTAEDIEAALQAYHTDHFIRMKNETVSKLTNIQIKQNKRNGRSQADHLKRARAVQAVDDPAGDWRNKDGRPSANKTVKEWRHNNPNGTKAACSRETKLYRNTVAKWW